MSSEQDYRDTSLASWEASAPGWARWSAAFDATARPVSEWMLERLDPRPGETVVELAAGTGDVGYAVAQRLAPYADDTGRQRYPGVSLNGVASQRFVTASGRRDLPDRRERAWRQGACPAPCRHAADITQPAPGSSPAPRGRSARPPRSD